MTYTPPAWDRRLAFLLLGLIGLCLLGALGSALVYGADGHEYQGALLLLAAFLAGPGLLAVIAAVAVGRGWPAARFLRVLPFAALAGEIALVWRG